MANIWNAEDEVVLRVSGGGIVAAGAPSGDGGWEDRDDGADDNEGDDNDPWDPDYEDDDAGSEPGDEAVNVRLPDGRMVIAYTHSSDLVDVLKTVLKNITGIPTRHQRLTYNNRELEDGSEFHIPEGHIVVLSMRIRGGGKRGAAAMDKTTSKSVSDDIKNTMNMMREKLVPEPIATSLNALSSILGEIDSAPKTVVSRLLASELVSSTTVSRLLIEVMSSSTRPTARCAKMAEIIFKETFDLYDDIEYQIARSRELYHKALLLLVMTQFGDTGGNVDWMNWQVALTDRLKLVVQHPAAPVGGAAAPVGGVVAMD